MCGIAGVLRHDLAPIDRGTLARMADMLAHRGPDDAGCWSRPGVALVHRRLAVIDPTPSARQPMANDSGTIQVAFNGEIYNFRELRNELERGGARFRTHSDTEVIVRGYERWGD